MAVDKHGVGARADDEEEVALGREMAPLKLKVGIARCIRLWEPPYDIPRSSHWSIGLFPPMSRRVESGCC